MPFKKILNALEANGSPMPEFETDEERTYFITRLFVHERFYEDLENEPKVSRKGAERRQEILNVLADNPLTTQTEIMEKLNLSRRQVQWIMQELQNEGILVREGTNRNGRWIVNL